ncbi:hypothetical protein A3B18_02260 [Candidatus Giovannonibacteria bacterium RIFCSPLOWO2_01_FULL_46_13]|uniref:RNA polymerase sigma factor n=1 Tax=Candidatus Giovannonibacteria bacterium RIFCSPLOWO2_01_FULL_46_13 TaxID=1798352 RepID=A0A1F5X517_9BACT|nr:MAG: hypothetical protein A3B18_02260 [Candidatus Giovannonibacteria bacterium RIFCSPLOWO2_01_FULL_46_13]
MIKEQNVSTFLDAYNKYSSAIYLHCFFRVFSKERAEELEQETFMKTWQYLLDGKEIKTIRPFLYRVAYNLIVDESRKKKSVSLDALLEDSKITEPSYEDYDSIERSALFKDVINKLLGFNKEEKSIITMRYVDDLEPHAIAEVLGTSPSNISVRLHRILAKLKKEF